VTTSGPAASQRQGFRAAKQRPVRPESRLRSQGHRAVRRCPALVVF